MTLTPQRLRYLVEQSDIPYVPLENRLQDQAGVSIANRFGIVKIYISGDGYDQNRDKLEQLLKQHGHQLIKNDDTWNDYYTINAI